MGTYVHTYLHTYIRVVYRGASIWMLQGFKCFAGVIAATNSMYVLVCKSCAFLEDGANATAYI